MIWTRVTAGSPWLALLLALALVTCKGSGCLPGDYISTCHEACGERGVAVVLSDRNVCICREAAGTEVAR